MDVWIDTNLKNMKIAFKVKNQGQINQNFITCGVHHSLQVTCTLISVQWFSSFFCVEGTPAHGTQTMMMTMMMMMMMMD